MEEIFSDYLGVFGEGPVTSDSWNSDSIQYGALNLSVAPKEGKAITLLADHLFSPALLLAERIERDFIPLHGRTVIELGAGCALPSLLAATMPRPPSNVVVTDYPDPIILDTLRKNVHTNVACYSPDCAVKCTGYDWGGDANALLSALPETSRRQDHDGGYDVIFLSDLIHFDSSHTSLIKSFTTLLSRTPFSRVYAAAGNYTVASVCDKFLAESGEAGILWEEGEHSDQWYGNLTIVGIKVESLGIRKGMCRWWTGKWKPDEIQR